MAVNKYWENETPIEVKGEKSVAKIYLEAGKIQAFPVVANSKYGIGKGATIDLETMSVEQLLDLREAINKAIDTQLTTESEAM
jgi:hypothetical protein